jgi:hypothetical protein
MTIYEQIIATYPELTDADFGQHGTILLCDDSDDLGAYVAKWEYFKPLPDGLKLGK